METSIIPKIFKNMFIIKVSNLEVMSLTIKFGWIVNILRPNKTGSLKQSFLNSSGFYILLGNKLINWSFLKNIKFIIFFISYY